jgi:L-asparaginase / beta-aspartyl-peptidase
MESRIAMAVHGGAYVIPEPERKAHRDGCIQALQVGWGLLEAGASSLDAVEAAVAALELDGAFGAGVGSALNEEGVVELDGGLMDGSSMQVGSVAGIQQVASAIKVARKVLDSQYALLVGDGAVRFAERNGLQLVDPRSLVSPRELRRWQESHGRQSETWHREMFGDTVGAVAVDRNGCVAAGTATGGSPRKPKGRVGDSPLVGCGLYADNRTAAVSTTGHGERLIPLVWAKTAADMVGAGIEPQAAADAAVELLERERVRGGLIIADRLGRLGIAWNTPQMAFACRVAGSSDFRAGPEG